MFAPADSMAFGLKNFIVVLSALLFSVGHSVCACLSQSPVAAYGTARISQPQEMGGHAAHYTASHGGVSEDGDAPCGPTNESCDHCQLTQFAATPDAGMLLAPAPVANLSFAVLVEAALPDPPRSVLKPVARLRWAAPPGVTPVSLKTRLLI